MSVCGPGGPTNNILKFILFYNMSICFKIKKKITE